MTKVVKTEMDDRLWVHPVLPTYQYFQNRKENQPSSWDKESTLFEFPMAVTAQYLDQAAQGL